MSLPMVGGLEQNGLWGHFSNPNLSMILWLTESLSNSGFALEEKKSFPSTEYYLKCFDFSTKLSNSSEGFMGSPKFSVLLINRQRVKEPALDLLPCLSQEQGCGAVQLVFGRHTGGMSGSSHCSYFSSWVGWDICCHPTSGVSILPRTGNPFSWLQCSWHPNR